MRRFVIFLGLLSLLCTALLVLTAILVQVGAMICLAMTFFANHDQDMKEPSEQPDLEETNTPREGTLAIVQCDGFRCMAIFDREGKWRDAVRKTELPRVIRVIGFLN